MEPSRSVNSEVNPEKEKQSEKPHNSDFKKYHKARVMKAVWYWQKTDL
jgi:hypothetical protein